MHYFGFLPVEVRPDIGTTLAAHLADEQRFDIGRPDLIGPRVGADGPMGAFIIRAIDQQPANAGCAHCAERDFLFALYHESVLWPGNEESDCLLEGVGIQHQRRCQCEPSPIRVASLT